MSETEISEAILGEIGRSARGGLWPDAAAGAEQLMVVLARAAATADGAALDVIAQGSAAEASVLVLDNDVSVEPSPLGVIWLLKTVAGIADAARSSAPRAEDGDSRTRILTELRRASSSGRTNVELASACQRSEETVSRVLRRLRADGEVETLSTGRFRRNWIAGARSVACEKAHSVAKVDVTRDEPPPAENAVERVLELT